MSADRFAGNDDAGDELFDAKEDFREFVGEIINSKFELVESKKAGVDPRLNLIWTVMLDEPVGDQTEAKVMIQADKTMVTDDGEWALDEGTMVPAPFHENTRMGHLVARAFQADDATFEVNGTEYPCFDMRGWFNEKGYKPNWAPAWLGHKFHFLTDVIEYNINDEKIVSRRVMPVEYLGYVE